MSVALEHRDVHDVITGWCPSCEAQLARPDSGRCFTCGTTLLDQRPEQTATHGWCPSCHDEAAINRAGVCLWCGSRTKPLEVHVQANPHREYVKRHRRLHPRLSIRQVRAAHRLYMAGWSYRAIADQIWRRLGFPTRGACMSGLYDSFLRAQLPKRDRGASVRKVPDVIAERAQELYEEGKSMAEVAEVLFTSTPHRKVERLEEALRREFRRRGWATRSTSETLKGRQCRTAKKCAAITNRGRVCGGNVIKLEDGSYGDNCWQHDPSYADRRDAIVHMERMRGRRRWVKDLVPMEPFVNVRRAELAGDVKPACRNPNFDGGLSRLAEALEMDVSQLTRLMRFEGKPGRAKAELTATKVQEYLDRDGTATFEQLYGDVALTETA